MPATILSDNGVSSGSAGLKTTAASDGALVLQTSTAGGTATTALSISNTQVVTYTNQPVYTGGTANGVAYLNGSKVLTTGSALYFDGTNLGVGTTSTNIFSRPSPTTLALSGSANAYIQINGATGNNAEIDLGINSVRQASIYTDATAFGLVANTNIPMLFSINNSEQMRLTSTGLGIGTSSPAAKLDIKGPMYVPAANFKALATLVSSDSQAAGNGAGITLGGVFTGTSTTAFGQIAGIKENSTDSNYAGVLAFYTRPNGDTLYERMRIDSSGNLLVGATSNANSYKIYAKNNNTNTTALTLENNNGGYQVYTSNSELAFFQLNVGERARIDSSGNLLVGTTSATGKLTVIDSSNPTLTSAYVENTNASFNQRVVAFNATRNTTNGSYKFISCSISSVQEKFYVFDSGSTYNITGTYGTISDIKLKENVVDATPKLADVMRLRVRNFNFKTEPDAKQIGFIAQEIEQVFPALVEETIDRDEEGNEISTTTKQVKTTVLIPVLIKAIQEQQALIQTLTDRITALENK